MTDPIRCPECEGRLGDQIGALFFACRFCQGRGWVGGEHEPGADVPRRRVPVWENRMWNDPNVAATFTCRFCLDARQVAHIDEAAGTIVTVPCLCDE